MIEVRIRVAASALRVSSRTLYRLCRSGRVAGRKVRGVWYVELNLGLSDRMVKVSSLADCAGYTPRYIQLLAARGALRSIRVGRQLRIHPDDAGRLLALRLCRHID